MVGVVSHCQIVIAMWSNSLSCWSTLASLLMLSWNLVSQYSRFVFGVEAFLHPGCLCQKHPCTKMGMSCSVSQMSGLPGLPLTFVVNAIPRDRNAERTAISGAVPDWPTALIFFRVEWWTALLKVLILLRADKVRTFGFKQGGQFFVAKVFKGYRAMEAPQRLVELPDTSLSGAVKESLRRGRISVLKPY